MAEEKKMTVKELIEEVEKTSKLKNEYDFGKHISLKYMPYSQKCALAKSIINSTSYEEVDNVKVYKRNTNAMLFVFTMKLIEMYTDIEINTSTIAKEYDDLMESGAMNGLMEKIPPSEISILRGMVDMERDDLEINTRSLVSFFENKAEAIKIAFDSLSVALENPDIQKKIEELKK